MVAFVSKKKKASTLVGAYLDDDAVRDVDERVSGRFSDRSAYVRKLLVDDLSHKPAPTHYDQLIINKLATVYRGSIAPRLSAQLAAAGADQPALLDQILTKLSEYLACGYKLEDLHIVPRTFTTYAESPEHLRTAAEKAQAIYEANKNTPTPGATLPPTKPEQDQKEA
jgi:Arc/MetJ-type ribon-helix-helix transcriptional regulator